MSDDFDSHPSTLPLSVLQHDQVMNRLDDLTGHAESNLASEFYKKLRDWLVDFDKSLDEQHEIGIRLVSFGQALIFHLEGIGYWDPALISFRGRKDSSEPVELIQHVSQISILLVGLPRLDPSKPKRPIGFTSDNNEEQFEESD